MTTRRIEKGIVAIELGYDGQPESVCIQVNPSIYLTPNAFSAQVLILALQRALEKLESRGRAGQSGSLCDDSIYALMNRARGVQEHEWSRIDALAINGAWKSGLTRLQSVYT